MNRRNVLYLISTGIVSIFLGMIGCAEDECTQLVKVSKVWSVSSKSSQSSKTTFDDFVPSSRQNPHWMDWEGRNIDLNNLSGQYISGTKRNPDGSYYVSTWIGFQNSITIQDGQEILMRSVNCVIKGDIKGTGTVIIESFAAEKNYNCPVGAILVVEGSVADTITLELRDNTTLEENGDGPLDTGNDLYTNGEIISVECSLELPFIYRDPKTGTNWMYESYSD